MNEFSLPSGSRAVLDSLRAALRDRLPQAVLLTGPAGSGKLRTAVWLAAALLCTGGADKPCGRCPACHKALDRAHPDLIVVDEGDAAILVDRARALRQEAAVLPNDGDRKVFILRHADRLNTAAQNALLKLLEEPPRYAFFILTSERPGELLETIRSRCTRFQFAPPQNESAQPDEETLAPLKDFIRALAARDEYAMLRASMQLEKLPKPAFQAALGALQAALHDAVFAAHGLPGTALPTLESASRALAAAVTDTRLLRLYDHLAQLSARCEINAAPVAQCAALCAGAFAICFEG